MADDDIDIEGEFDFKTEVGDGLYDANELPSKSANLLPEYTNPPWMLEQGWSLDNCMDEKSKATIERMLLEEQQYMNGHKKGKYLGINKSVLLITPTSPKSPKPGGPHEHTTKRQWTDEEKKLFLKGLEQFGRSWSKISKLIPSRTTVQVKNYAQQFMKNQAKKAGQSQVAVTHTASAMPTVCVDAALLTHNRATTTSSASFSSSSATFSSLSATSSSAALLMQAAEAVCTGKPTILSRSRPTPAKPKPRTTKTVSRKKILSVISHTEAAPQDPIDLVGSLDLVSSPHPAPSTCTSFLPVTNVLNGHTAVTLSSASVVEASQDQKSIGSSTVDAEFSQASSHRNTAKVKENNAEESESDEIDIDIENDDDDVENAILQSRSASPSSVYHRLLQQANVITSSLPDLDGEHSLHHDAEEADGNSQESVHGLEDDSSTGLDSNDGSTQNSDTGLSSSASSQRTDASSSLTGDDRGGERFLQYPEEAKLIVNGVIASSGEVFEFPIPIEAKELQANGILEEEKKVHAEFFDGRPLKTPERYLKIRNYILDCWRKSRPSYLNKTSVRPGLKNCGDVNCIGRIHAYLECIGAINFGCEQASYNNPGRGSSVMSKSKNTGRDQQPFLSATKLEAMRPRKRRIRDASGHWVDEKELEGKTIEHCPEKDDASKSKSSRGPKAVYDPFKLVPCQPFSAEAEAPYKLEVVSTALAVMDIHAHISRTEVIGMLGGHFNAETTCLTVSMAVPCKSISTVMQCEMDPVSQTLASEQIEDVGMQVVGWYHSHPTFAPNPSVRDIETQQKFQYWFAKGGSHFVGMIISPYSPQNANVISDIRCLTIGSDIATEYLCNRPYQFQYRVAFRDNLREILGPASELAEKYSNYASRVALSCVYKPSLGITCLSKMLQSVKHRLEPPDPEHPISGSRRKVEDVLHWLEQIFLEKFSAASTPGMSSSHADIAPLSTAVPPTDDDEQM